MCSANDFSTEKKGVVARHEKNKNKKQKTKTNREADLLDVSCLVSFLLSLHQLQLPLQFYLVKCFYNRLSRKIVIANLGGAVERRRNNER